MNQPIEIAIPADLLTTSDLHELRRRAIAAGMGPTIRRLEKLILWRKFCADAKSPCADGGMPAVEK